MDMTGGKCNLCDENFTNKSERMWHRKQYQGQGTCWFGDMKCWFKHENIEQSNKNKDNEELSDGHEIENGQ